MKINEYSVKYDKGYNLKPFIKTTYTLDRENKYGFRNPISAIELLKEIYDVQFLAEENTFVFAIKGTKLLGIYPMSKGTDCSCDMSARMIFKFLLLVGANSFILAHNHPNGNSDMSQDDYEVTLNIIKASEFMEMDFIDHIIIGKDDSDCIKNDVLDMQEKGIENVVDYYELVDLEFN